MAMNARPRCAPDSSRISSLAPTSQSAVTPRATQLAAYALHRTRLHSSIASWVLYRLSRLKNRFPLARGSSGYCLHISAFMIASKACSLIARATRWSKMPDYLEWVLNVKPDDLHDFRAMVQREFGSASPAPATIAVSIPREPARTRKRPTADYAHANPYPSPVSTPPPSPTHSNWTSPALSTCQTPPWADPVKVPAKGRCARRAGSTIGVRRTQDVIVPCLAFVLPACFSLRDRQMYRTTLPCAGPAS
ncbi:hypothetical protein FRC08_006892 [Ceratobasidium sp. 394]|nr:hypothetical protein FRC08_006892 [Ceratobasidium sp. 394]